MNDSNLNELIYCKILTSKNNFKKYVNLFVYLTAQHVHVTAELATERVNEGRKGVVT